jgi:catechol 2,3-dioxygenase-like lactoylglutathione lyase family enzyme
MHIPIGDLYHVIHAGDELASLDAWYDTVFFPRRGILDNDYFAPQNREASLLAIGDCIVEAMAPRKETAGWQSTSLGKFNARLGSHWHSIAFYTDDVGAVWERLVEQGIRVVIGGRPEDSPDGRPGAFTPIYTHPRDTVAQLEFMRRRPRLVARDFAMPGELDPRYLPGWSSDWWRTHHPLGIERLAYLSLVTADREKAHRLFVEILGGTVLLESHSALTGTTDLYIALGTQTILQIALPDDGHSVAGRDLAANGEALHAVAFTVADLDAAERHLGQQGLAILGRDAETLVVDPAGSFGAPYRFTTFRAPGDPRDGARDGAPETGSRRASYDGPGHGRGQP